MKRIVFIVIMALMAVSCSFLNEMKPTTLSDVYGSEIALEADVRGIVRAFDNTQCWTGESHEKIFTGSGITHWSNSSNSSRLSSLDWTSNLQFTAFASNPSLSAFFKNHYTAIDRCNSLLEGLKTSPVNQAYKTEIEAEARFYRAFIYYTLVRMMGDLPLRLEPSSMNNLNSARTKYDKIYTLIVKDLEYAFANMRTAERVKMLTPYESRPNRYAAKAYLASVYLTIGSLLSNPDDNFWNNTKPERVPDFSAIGVTSADDAFKLALKYSEAMIPESSAFDLESPYRLASDFGDLFKWTRGYVTKDGCDCWNLPERIFVYSITNEASSSYLAKRTLPQYVEGTLDVTQTDGNYGRWRPTRWLYQKWCETYPGSKGNGLSSDVYLTSSDPRLALSMYANSYINLNTQKKQAIYPGSGCIAKPEHQYGMPYFRKYFSDQYNFNAGEADFYFMRLTEVYLIAAEAAAWLGETDKAYGYIEILHARARRSVPEGQPEAEAPCWTAGQFSTRQELVNAIFWERVFELTGEGHEWFDTHRFGAHWIVENISKPKNAFLELKEQSGSDYSGASGSYRDLYYGKNFQYSEDPSVVRKGLLMVMPSSETSYNTNITNSKNDFHY